MSAVKKLPEFKRIAGIQSMTRSDDLGLEKHQNLVIVIVMNTSTNHWLMQRHNMMRVALTTEGATADQIHLPNWIGNLIAGKQAKR